MSMEAFGAWALHPASTPHPKPCQGLGLPPRGGQSKVPAALTYMCMQPLSWSPTASSLLSMSYTLPFSLLLFLPLPTPPSGSVFLFSRKSVRGKGKGQKRKRKKSRPCGPCSERRKHLFVQDPQTCKCSCKNTDSRCKARQLELNERTCRCDKPRR